jgi:hypothetical protein
MAIWPYDRNMAIWPYHHMAIWHQRRPIWVLPKKAIKIQQSGQGIKSIQPSCKKWEQKWSDGIFSFVFFGISFVYTENGGHSTIMPNFLSFHAFLSRGHHFLRIQRNLSHIRKENMPPDNFCYHLRQNGWIDLPSLPDCHIFIGVSENTHYGHLRCHNSHMATWLFDAIMAIRPVSHMAIMALNVGNMGVFGNGTKNVTIWRRR